MSFTGFNTQGGVHMCFPFYERLITCARGEALPIKMCTLEGEDFMECITRRKEYAVNYRISKELRHHKLLAIPHYDEDKDEFRPVTTIPNADTYFRVKEDK